jgi:hypothetical protein
MAGNIALISSTGKSLRPEVFCVLDVVIWFPVIAAAPSVCGAVVEVRF